MSDLNTTELYNTIYKISKEFPENDVLTMNKLVILLEEKYDRTFSSEDKIIIKKQAIKVSKQLEEEENEEEIRPKKKAAIPEFIALTSDGKKRASVSVFKGKKYLNLREYYEEPTSGELKPTKKGITLDYEGFKKLKENMELFETMFK